MSFLEGLSSLFDDLPEGAAGIDATTTELGSGSAVDNADTGAVEDFAKGPTITANSSEAEVGQFVQTNPYANSLWQTAKTVATSLGKSVAEAGVVFGVMYGLNKVVATHASQTNQRTPLSTYLQQVQQNFTARGLTWNDTIQNEVATAAATYPWIDPTS